MKYVPILHFFGASAAKITVSGIIKRKDQDNVGFNFYEYGVLRSTKNTWRVRHIQTDIHSSNGKPGTSLKQCGLGQDASAVPLLPECKI